MGSLPHHLEMQVQARSAAMRARTWPVRGDVWVGDGERIRVIRMVRTEVLVDANHARVVVPFASWGRVTKGLRLEVRGG